MGTNLTWNIALKGFGLFKDQLNAELKLSASKVAVYAGNGQGKTCISRLFRAADQDCVTAVSDTMINRAGSTGEFEFSFSRKDTSGKLHISKTRGDDPTIENDTGYLFHVFNTDYVRDNLQSQHYSINGDVFSGYIVGRENIDVSDKRKRLEELEKKGKQKRNAIDDAVAQAQSELKNYKLSRLNEYKTLTTENVLKLENRTNRYDAALAKFNALKNLPDDIPTLAGLVFDDKALSLDVLKEILKTSYTRESFAEDFADSMRRKRTFVEKGLTFLEGTEADDCPFCGRKFDDSALQLIHMYEEYLKGQEAKTISAIDGQINALRGFLNDYKSLCSDYWAKATTFDSLKSAFNDIAKISLEKLPEYSEVENAVTAVNDALGKKKENISLALSLDSVESLRVLLESIREHASLIKEAFSQFDIAANNLKKEMTDAKNGLCIERKYKVRNECDKIILERTELLAQYKSLEAEIKEAESKGRRPKRQAVANMLASLVHSVFGARYIFNPDDFTISLGDVELGDDVEDIMSDGEKFVLAFCHYVASTWNLLENDDDAKKLFFVIDDPISSLDYHYVYSVVQIIRDLNVLFDESGNLRVRFLLLTHNSAFFNMLARNKIVQDLYTLHGAETSRCDKRYITPYSEHLQDLYDVAIEGSDPTHTTGNSIRQVIETLWRFDNPAEPDLLHYLNAEECSDLRDCEFIYTVCNDQSHGASIFDRDQLPDDEAIRCACLAVLNHLQDRYPGQLVASGLRLAASQNE